MDEEIQRTIEGACAYKEEGRLEGTLALGTQGHHQQGSKHHTDICADSGPHEGPAGKVADRGCHRDTEHETEGQAHHVAKPNGSLLFAPVEHEAPPSECPQRKHHAAPG